MKGWTISLSDVCQIYIFLYISWQLCCRWYCDILNYQSLNLSWWYSNNSLHFIFVSEDSGPLVGNSGTITICLIISATLNMLLIFSSILICFLRVMKKISNSSRRPSAIPAAQQNPLLLVETPALEADTQTWWQINLLWKNGESIQCVHLVVRTVRLALPEKELNGWSWQVSFTWVGGYSGVFTPCWWLFDCSDLLACLSYGVNVCAGDFIFGCFLGVFLVD